MPPGHGPSPADVSRSWLEPTSKGLSDVLLTAPRRKGAVKGVTRPSFRIFLENGQKRKSRSSQSEFCPREGSGRSSPWRQTLSGGLGPPLLPGERHTERRDTHPLGGVPVLREEEKDTDVAVRDVLLALLIETLCINRERIQQRSEMVFLSRKLNI